MTLNSYVKKMKPEGDFDGERQVRDVVWIGIVALLAFVSI